MWHIRSTPCLTLLVRPYAKSVENVTGRQDFVPRSNDNGVSEWCERIDTNRSYNSPVGDIELQVSAH
ncbi:unnamed protein product [Calypogeia fissa]